MPEITCVRCGQVKPAFERPPFPGAIGPRIVERSVRTAGAYGSPADHADQPLRAQRHGSPGAQLPQAEHAGVPLQVGRRRRRRYVEEGHDPVVSSARRVGAALAPSSALTIGCAARRRPTSRAHPATVAATRNGLGRLRARHSVSARQGRAAGLAAAVWRLHADVECGLDRASQQLIARRARRRLHHVRRLADRDRREAERDAASQRAAARRRRRLRDRRRRSGSAAATSFRTTSIWVAGRCSRYQMGLGATRDTSLAYQEGRITALEARALGVHIAFAPVLDVNNNPANPVIGMRSFGEDPRLVADMGRRSSTACRSNGDSRDRKAFPRARRHRREFASHHHHRPREPRANRLRWSSCRSAAPSPPACKG